MTHKPAYDELERRLHLSLTLLNKVNNGIAIYKAGDNGNDFTITYINAAVEKIEAVKKEEVIGRSVLDVFPGITDLGLLDVLKRVWRTGKPEHFPTALYTDDRIRGWRDNRVSKLSADEIVAVYTDETQIKTVEQSLKKSEVFFQTVFDTIQDGITVLDIEMNIVKMNRAMEKWYAPQHPYIGKKCYNTYHGRNSACEECPAKRAIDTGRLHTKVVPRGGPAGTPGWIELSAFPISNPDGKTIGAVEYVRNITARKKAEVELQNSEKKLREIINFLPDPTWVIDMEGKVILWNQAIERLTGIKAEEIVGKGDYEYALPLYGERRPILIDLVLKSDGKWEEEYTYLEKDGDVLANSETFHPLLGKQGMYLSGTAAPLYNSAGEKVGAIESIRDITEKKRLELEKEKIIKDELEEALSSLKLLSGLLPICSCCKKIRDDKGYWNQIEQYIGEHSEAEFSHGLCPGCVEELYGDNDWYKKMRTKP